MTPATSPVSGYMPHPTMVDFPAHMAAVFVLPGCNFRCAFCHNSSLWQPRETFGWDRLEQICHRFLDLWVDGAVVSGGEPTLQPALPELLQFLRRQSFAVKLDTNGGRPDVLRRVMALVDYVAMDIKCSLEQYPKVTGFADTALVAESIALIKAEAPDYEFRTTVVEAIHTDDEIQSILELARGARRFVLQPFLPREDLPDASLRQAPRTSPVRLKTLAERFRGAVTDVVVRGV